MSHAPGRKAALASSRAKTGVLIACALLGAHFYVTQERKNAAPAAPPQELPREVQDLLSHLNVTSDERTTAQIGKIFYDSRNHVYCGEVNGHNTRGGDARLKDGMRVFVCGPGLHNLAAQ
jgi:hypothetical protein